MIQVNIAKAKTELSKLLRAVRNGELVIICDRNIPIAQLSAVSPRPLKKRPLGPIRPGFELSTGFFEPLPHDIQELFDGHGP